MMLNDLGTRSREALSTQLDSFRDSVSGAAERVNVAHAKRRRNLMERVDAVRKEDMIRMRNDGACLRRRQR